nr:MAG TPA: hypothetical protein [Caudoviricetes sp.]
MGLYILILPFYSSNFIKNKGKYNLFLYKLLNILKILLIIFLLNFSK